MRTLKPVFLTEEIAEKAVDSVVVVLTHTNIGRHLKRLTFHIVILVPITEEPANWPAYELKPYTLYQQTIGDKANWTGKYDEIARCKALQLWHGRNDGGTDVMPHLLFPCDTPYWGGVKRDGIVVACSGVQPWFDRMIAGMIADACIALAYEAFMTRENKKADFV